MKSFIQFPKCTLSTIIFYNLSDTLNIILGSDFLFITQFTFYYKIENAT
jgi:hypothetical protein